LSSIYAGLCAIGAWVMPGDANR